MAELTAEIAGACAYLQWHNGAGCYRTSLQTDEPFCSDIKYAAKLHDLGDGLTALLCEDHAQSERAAGNVKAIRSLRAWEASA